MKTIIAILFVIFATASPAALYAGGKCTGKKPCSACSSCSGCKYCAKDGGECGTCAKPKPKHGEPKTGLPPSEKPKDK